MKIVISTIQYIFSFGGLLLATPCFAGLAMQQQPDEDTRLYGFEQGFRQGEFAGSVHVRTLRMEEVEENLQLEMEITVSSEAVNRRQSWTIIPELYCPDGDTAMLFPAVMIKGKVRNLLSIRNNRFEQHDFLTDISMIRMEVDEGRDTVFFYSVSVPYELWMDAASLRLRQVLTSPAGKKQLFTSEDSGGIVLMAREPYTIQPQVNFVVPEREEKRRNIQGKAYLDFPSGGTAILPTFRNNPQELAKIDGIVSKVINDPDIEILSLLVDGFASPEGSYALNERLSRERAVALKDYLRVRYGFDESLFRVSSVAEDWDGLKALLAESSIPQKENIYRIIDEEWDFDRREARLKILRGPYQTIYTEMYPRLRRVEYQIDFSVKDYDIEETRQLASRNPDMLSQRELFLLALTYPIGSSQRDEIFDLMLRKFPDEVATAVNSAAAMLIRDEDSAARRYLERAGNHPSGFNNWGVYHMKRGDLDRAEEYFKNAASYGIPEALHNLNEVNIKREDNKTMARYVR